eukprot:scaffold23567_cov52-Attheya_sp.AAC.4
MNRVDELAGSGADQHVLVLRDGSPIPSLRCKFNRVSGSILVKFARRAPQSFLDTAGVFRSHRNGHDTHIIVE